MKGKNYFTLEKLSFRFNYFCFIDVSEYFADELFIKNRIRVWFQKEYRKEDTDYVAIFCKIKKQDRDMFISTMEELEKKMILMGYSNYSEFCEELSKSMN